MAATGIPFILDGRMIIKNVTKNTTCSDVINKLPCLETPLAVFESIDGVEKELTGKAKLLKVWRAHGSAKKVAFVIRKSNILTKIKKPILKWPLSSKKCNNSSIKYSQRKPLYNETPNQVSDLAFYVRHQTSKNQPLRKETVNKSDVSEKNRLMSGMESNASVNSMDAFLAKSLKSTKLGIKQKFAPKKKVGRATSTGTISSTDTGYHSSCSESEGNDAADEKCSTISTGSLNLYKRHTVLFSEETDGPRHSTPVFAGRTQKRRAYDFESTLSANNTLNKSNLEQMNKLQGNIILERFIADQTRPVSSTFPGNDDCDSSDMKRNSMPKFNNQKDVCRFFWNTNCDSDSDSDSEADISQPCESLDIAFNAGENNSDDQRKFQKRTLRRESAISNLGRFSFLSRDIGLDTSGDSDGYDYSFDFSFPRMNETQSENFSMDLSYDFDDSDSEKETSYNEDDFLDSFMKTRSFLDVSAEITSRT